MDGAPCGGGGVVGGEASSDVIMSLSTGMCPAGMLAKGLFSGLSEPGTWRPITAPIPVFSGRENGFKIGMGLYSFIGKLSYMLSWL